MVALDEPLQNGQMVEILTKKEEKPSQDWLQFVKTGLARNKIREWFKKNKTGALSKTDQIKEVLKKAKQIIIRPVRGLASNGTSQKTPAPLLSIPSVVVEGDNKILTNMAKCCHPKPGDAIPGYITVNRSVSVH